MRVAVAALALMAPTPPIVVEQPLQGAHVHSPLVVSGTANVFEARLDVDVRSPAGRLLAHRGLSATAGTGTRGRFRVAIPLPGRRGAVTVLVYSRSPKDGARINLRRITVTLAG